MKLKGWVSLSKILYTVEDKIAYITLNRPEVLNSLDYQTLKELEEAVQQTHINKDIQVVIFTGAGTKAFCAGADLKERKTLNDQQVRRNVKAISSVFKQISELPMPTIAAINGHAFGGGFELALACDFRFAVSEAKMGLTETSMGIIPGAGGTQRLPRLIGMANAMELILTARRITAEEALQYGILNRVVESENLLESCKELGNDIAKNAPVAIRQAKFAIHQGMATDMETGLKIEEKAYELTIPTKDRVEALQAFAEKRPPVFIGE